jgi:hypothetical protein
MAAGAHNEAARLMSLLITLLALQLLMLAAYRRASVSSLEGHHETAFRMSRRADRWAEKWWTFADGNFAAEGFGGQTLRIIPICVQ